MLNLPSHHSITSSARASSLSGKLRPSAFVVVKLMTRSNLGGCSTGMSAGFAPRRILSAYSARAGSRKRPDLPRVESRGRGLEGHRLEAQGFRLPFRPLARLAENPACAAVTREAEEEWGKR